MRQVDSLDRAILAVQLREHKIFSLWLFLHQSVRRKEVN